MRDGSSFAAIQIYWLVLPMQQIRVIGYANVAIMGAIVIIDKSKFSGAKGNGWRRCG